MNLTMSTLAAAFALVAGTSAHAAPLSSPSESASKGSMAISDQATRDAQAVGSPQTQVTIAFTIRVPESNEVIPNNVRRFTPGSHELIPAFENALFGMKPGERKRIELKPEEAFGMYDEHKLMRVKRETLPATAQSGSIYHASDGRPFSVVAITGETAVVDFNHPLAGKHLVLDVQVLRVEPLS